MAATAPMPREVAGCFDKAGDYGRYVIASGPYMLEGSDQLDATSCDTLKPISGYDPNASMALVRNPSYDPATDDTEARESLPDRFEFTINTNRSDIYAKIRAGELEAEIASMPPKVLREYSQSDELKDRLFLFPIDATWYLSMNLTTPPFDDIHVRKAVNLVMDKEGLRRVWGGQLRGEIARHVLPDSMVNDLLADYDPYPSPDFAGDVQAAQDEMRQSAYDTDGDGMCDAAACDEVLNAYPTVQTFRDMAPIIEDSLAKIGITIRSQGYDDPFGVVETPANNVPFTSALGWNKDFADAATYMVLFDSRNIQASGNSNHSLVGLTPEQAAGLDGFEGNAEGVPSVDADIDRCSVLLGDERVQCWADLDRKLMEEVVPWVPYLNETHADVVSDAVVQYEFDQFPAEAAYAHFAVDASKQ
jgi:peptide/nickel transport system substrate-binding protein